jgi:hypothetical protein
MPSIGWVDRLDRKAGDILADHDAHRVAAKAGEMREAIAA